MQHEDCRDDFKKSGSSTWHEGKTKYQYLSPSKLKGLSIKADTSVDFSEGVQALEDFGGVASDVLHSAYRFVRKSNNPEMPKVYYNEQNKGIQSSIKLAETKNQSKEWANGRGDIEGSPAFFVEQA